MGIKSQGLCWTGMVLLFFTQSLWSATPVPQLKQGVDAGQFEQVYALARQSLIEWEGEPEFDFYYGLAAIETGHVSEGVFALERVLFVYPAHGRARLELARGYFLLGEDVRSRQEFNAVLATNPPPNVVANIERFLNSIRLRETRYRLSANGYLEVGMGHDTNVNSAPEDANFFSPFLGLQGTLNATSTQAHDRFQQISFGGQLNKPFRPGWSAFARLDGQARDNQDREDFDTDALTVQGGVSLRHKANQYRVNVQRQRYFVGNAANRDLLGITGEWTHLWTPRLRFSSFLQAAKLENPGQPIRDAKLFSTGLSVMRSFAMRYSPAVSVSLLAGTENPETNNNSARAVAERDFVGVRLNAQLQLRPKLSANSGIFVQRSKYGAESILFSSARNDEFYGIDMGMIWLMHKHWQIRGSINYSKNDANIIINEYNRLHGQVKLRVEF